MSAFGDRGVGVGGIASRKPKAVNPPPKDTAWRRPVGKSDGFAFHCANPEFGKFYRPRLCIPRPAGPRDPPFSPPEHRNALRDVSRPHHRGWPCSVTPRRCPVPSRWGETAPGTWERSRASTPLRCFPLGEMLGFSEDRGEGSAAGRRDTMLPIVLLTPSPEGTRTGPCRPGLWMRTWCERAWRACAVIWFVPPWLVKVCWDVVESSNLYRKYPRG
ncbi:uncharacterized protein LOC128151497 [Harpia harpyja]|uniref:uncharacterized protein LOC128151497 n=1 Tax=Harpia harpyja TaxID=202280 RepID=UPI0022B0CB92|nr:uncharacterized protein LOC128151497 [Harpia harpyja]